MVWCCDEVKFVLLVEFCLKWEYHDFLEDRFGNRKGRKWQFHISIRICENKTRIYYKNKKYYTNIFCKFNAIHLFYFEFIVLMVNKYCWKNKLILFWKYFYKNFIEINIHINESPPKKEQELWKENECARCFLN